ncbi:LisH domain-containing protein [Actinidia chinensis var. chinensis]|uniref:LisH domain-containing protein n=1 Tax=Actinidia chinensis var. chinensis TaxID=1590841 RepID=A0A2R6Q7R5_ACTCC|nr:LisH domain-containing protein [Actinidia chinensis var. chinensis]
MRLIRPGLSLKLPRIEITVLCGFFVLLAMKRLFAGMKWKGKHMRLEKEIMERKMKARKEKEKLVKDSVEVIQDPIEKQMDLTERPQLKTDELMDFIMKEKASIAMARRAQEVEKPGSSLGDSDEGDNLTLNEREDVSLPNELSDEYSSQIRTLMPTSFSDLKRNDMVFSEKALVENSNNAQASSTSRCESFVQDVINQESGVMIPGMNEMSQYSTSIMKPSHDAEILTQDVINQESGVNIPETNKVSQSSDTLNSQSNKPKKSFRNNSRVICSVKEAREFLSKILIEQQPSQELEDKTEPEGAAILSLDHEKESVLKREESVSTGKKDPEAADKGHGVNDLQMPRALGHEANIGNADTGPSVLVPPGEKEMGNNTSWGLDKDNKVFQPTILGGPSDSASDASACRVRESNSRSTETIPSMNKENWMEENFHTLEPFEKKIGSGFRDNAREKVEQGLDLNTEMRQLISDGDASELNRMKDDSLREIVFQVRENELAGHDPFYLMGDEDKLSFFESLERKIEKENEKLSILHGWIHSNIENLNYGADGISLYDPPEKIIPHWKGPPVEKIHEFLNNKVTARNSESDPEIKAVVKDVGKDLDRWITEKEIQEAGDLMGKLPKRGQQFLEKRLSKVKREMELFGPQAVMSKYLEYAEEKLEDYLWWLDLPYVLYIELYTHENEELKIGLYSLEMAADLELDPKQYHVIAFEDPADCKNLCYIIQAHMEMLGSGKAFVVAQPPKVIVSSGSFVISPLTVTFCRMLFGKPKQNDCSVTVIRKRELQLNVDQTLEEVEEQISEIGSKIYHDKIRQERVMDVNLLTKGVLNSSKPPKRRRSKRKPKKPTK